MDRFELILQQAQQALATLAELATLSSPSDVERDAAIQRFEYSCETTWKAAQKYLQEFEKINARSPREVVRRSRELGLLGDQDAISALAMLDDRNLTVHTYNRALAEVIFRRLNAYYQLLTQWLSAIEARQ
jgi:nucleotidyltransferase substrate binding protein (TIGR01987 family)